MACANFSINRARAFWNTQIKKGQPTQDIGESQDKILDLVDFPEHVFLLVYLHVCFSCLF